MKENTSCNTICTVFICKNNHLNAGPQYITGKYFVPMREHSVVAKYQLCLGRFRLVRSPSLNRKAVFPHFYTHDIDQSHSSLISVFKSTDKNPTKIITR